MAVTFAPDVARRDLVPLGTADDDYAAQQSIRTLFNTTRPDRHYVKMALAIQNMGFLRGLSPAYMRATPAINDWVFELVSEDPTLAECGFEVLRERVSDRLHRRRLPPDARTPARTARCSPRCGARAPCRWSAPTERLATMAALLHRDADGDAFVTALRAGVGAARRRTGSRRYLRAYLRPLVHCLLAHELAFMPHGENLILVLDGHAVSRVLMKDIGEEVAVLGDSPAARQRRARPAGGRPTDEQALAIFTDVFDGVFRHLAAILDTRRRAAARTVFWALVRECVDEHAADHPGLETAVDLRADRFAHSCLNRLQLRNTLQMVDLTDQSSSLIYAGHARAEPRCAVTVFRDALGVPHVRGRPTTWRWPASRASSPRATAAGRSRSTGWRAEGRLAERIGADGVEWDRFARRARLADTAQRAYDGARRRGPRVRRRLRGGRERGARGGPWTPSSTRCRGGRPHEPWSDVGAARDHARQPRAVLDVPPAAVERARRG